MKEVAQIVSGWLDGIIVKKWTHLCNSTLTNRKLPAPQNPPLVMLQGVTDFMISNAIDKFCLLKKFM